MPWKRHRYPTDWRAIVARILDRAERRCEWAYPAGTRCDASHHAWIHRAVDDLEVWEECAAAGPDCTGRDVDEVFRGEMHERPLRVVLTTAHTCDCEPPCGIDAHLLSLCQLHHLRLDAGLHARNAAETRRQRRIAGGQLTLELS
jgi:hypothetical protein